MGFFRNPEVRKSLYVYIILSAVLIVGGAYFDIKYAAAAVVCCVVYALFHFIETFLRYRRLAELSNEIDRILHGKKDIVLQKYAEGEIAILYSEIYKMTVRLKEQAESLKADKIYLADSIADISHQIRTPLTSINFIATFLSEDTLSDERRLELTKELFSLLSKIDWLVNSLLKISKLDAGTIKFKSEKVNLYSLVKKSAQAIEISMDLRNQSLEINSDKTECFYGDFSWTVEAIENILKNCMEHTDRGGKITVSLKETPVFSQIVITDNGCGLDEEDIPNLFKRFYKGKGSAASSVGIGLALSKMIVLSQNGTIKAENNPDSGGARFIIKFYKTTI